MSNLRIRIKSNQMGWCDMRYRKFGRTPWDISEITFGAWQLGGTWGQVSEKDPISTLLYAFDNGINMVDTAAAYGGGRSEELVGKAIASRRSEKIYVATKILPIGVNHGIQNIDSINYWFNFLISS